MRQGLFVLFLMLILAFFMIGFQSQHQESNDDQSNIVSTEAVTASPYVSLRGRSL